MISIGLSIAGAIAGKLVLIAAGYLYARWAMKANSVFPSSQNKKS